MRASSGTSFHLQLSKISFQVLHLQKLRRVPKATLDVPNPAELDPLLWCGAELSSCCCGLWHQDLLSDHGKRHLLPLWLCCLAWRRTGGGEGVIAASADGYPMNHGLPGRVVIPGWLLLDLFVHMQLI